MHVKPRYSGLLTLILAISSFCGATASGVELSLINPYNFSETEVELSFEGHKLSMVRNEFEFLLHKLDAVSTVSTLHNVTNDCPDEIEIKTKVVHSVTGIDENTDETFGPFLDVVEDLAYPYAIVKDIPVVLLHEVFASQLARSADCSILIEHSGGRHKIPLKITVYDTAIKSQSKPISLHFPLDINSISHWYGFTDRSKQLGNLVFSATKTLASFGIVSDTFTTEPDKGSNESIATLVQQSSGNHSELQIPPNLEVHLPAPKFTDLASFSVDVTFTVDKDTNGSLIAYDWFSRPAGFSIKLHNNSILFSYYNTSSYGKAPSTTNLGTIFESGNPISLKLNYSGTGWTIYREDTNQTFEAIGALEPAYGGKFTLGPLSSAVTFSQVEWYCQACVFKRSTSDSHSTVKSIREYWQQVALDPSFETRLHTNTTTRFKLMPIDEAIDGPMFERNLSWATSERADTPPPIMHNVGNLKGKHLSKKQKATALKRLLPHIDILGINPRVADQWSHIIKQYKVDVAPYLHSTDRVESQCRLYFARDYFWKLYTSGRKHTTHWNTNLWFQPAKPNRPARWIKQTENGFLISKRNPSSITSGLLLYPGKNALLPSLRLFALRDGIEDFALLADLSLQSSESTQKNIRKHISTYQPSSHCDAKEQRLPAFPRSKILNLFAQKL